MPSLWISSLVLVLVLLSAGLHATWNLLVKRGEDTLIASWLTALVAPVVLWPLLFLTGLPPPPAWSMLLASGITHAAYNVALARAYEHGDLSVVYPVARGLAPLLVGMGAPVLLGESLSHAAMGAIALVGGGIAWLGLSAWRTRANPSGLLWAGITAGLIATYSMLDKVGVMRSNPLAYAVTLFGFDAVFVTPYVLLHRDPRQIRKIWHGRRRVCRHSRTPARLNPGTCRSRGQPVPSRRRRSCLSVILPPMALGCCRDQAHLSVGIGDLDLPLAEAR